jgi:hypothetical protein
MDTSDETDTWIEWFCAQRGHEFMCEIDSAFIGEGKGTSQAIATGFGDDASGFAEATVEPMAPTGLFVA